MLFVELYTNPLSVVAGDPTLSREPCNTADGLDKSISVVSPTETSGFVQVRVNITESLL